MNRYVAGTAEHVVATVTADVVLDEQTVAISVNKGVTWRPAVWLDSPGFTRRCRTSTAVTFPSPTRGEVLVRVTDISETPIMEAGDYMVVPI